jgi:hypothetical protein
MLVTIIAVVVSALVASALTFFITYVKMVRPSDAYVSSLKHQLEREEKLTSDITTWVQIETGRYPQIWRAVQQRINERLRVQ